MLLQSPHWFLPRRFWSLSCQSPTFQFRLIQTTSKTSKEIRQEKRKKNTNENE